MHQYNAYAKQIRKKFIHQLLQIERRLIMQNLEQLREKIDVIDAAIIKKLAERQKLARRIGKFKAANNIPLKIRPENKPAAAYEKLCEQYDLSPDFVKRLFKIIITHSRKQQKK